MTSKKTDLYDLIDGRKYKKCKEHQIRNPYTKRCINKPKELKPKEPKTKKEKPKECPEGKILNPKTDRCVSITGTIGKQLASTKNPVKVTDKGPVKGNVKSLVKSDEIKAKFLLKKLINRKRKIRLDKEKRDKSDDIYKDDNHKELCENYKKYLHYIKDIKVKELIYKLNYALFKNNIDSTVVEYTFYDIKIHYTNKNKNVVTELYENLKDIDKINEAIKQNDKYINLLSQKQKRILQHYNLTISAIIKMYLLYEQKFTLEWLHKYINTFYYLFVYNNDKNFTLYEQIYDYYKIHDTKISEHWKYDNLLSKRLDEILVMYKLIPIKDFKEIIKTYINDLNAIINKAPKLKEKIVVYYNDEELSQLIEVDKTNTNKNFLLTSIILDKVILNNSPTIKKYIQRITIDKGIPLIFLEGINNIKNNFHILLPSNTRFIVKKPINKIVDYYNSTIPTEIVCTSQSKEKLYLTDVHLIGSSSLGTIKSSLLSIEDSKKEIDEKNNKYCKYYDLYKEKQKTVNNKQTRFYFSYKNCISLKL